MLGNYKSSNATLQSRPAGASLLQNYSYIVVKLLQKKQNRASRLYHCLCPMVKNQLKSTGGLILMVVLFVIGILLYITYNKGQGVENGELGA